MPFPAPNLDDRRFQDLVDDAKRMVQQRCPEWTDHNVSDPGVTLIEAFATMVDQLLFRLNQVPERHYMRFLDMVGLQLHPPAAAEADITFWLSAPQDAPVEVPAGTEVSTLRTEQDDPTIFTVVEPRTITNCGLLAAITRQGDGQVEDVTATLVQVDPGFKPFQLAPEVDDELLIGLDAAVGGCVVRLRMDADIEGVGVDPTNPPLAWESWDGDQWTPCELERDTTGGFNTEGEVVLHVPRNHALAPLRNQRAGWLRCRVVASKPDQPAYSQSPMIRALEAETIGGTARAVQAEVRHREIVGVSDGTAAQRFALLGAPVVPSDEPRRVRVGVDGVGWTDWTEVDDFSYSRPDDRHFAIDPIDGAVVFGPAVRSEDGSLRHYGAVPEKGTSVMVSEYRSGGGRSGNVSARALRVLRSSIAFIDTVENRRAAKGGVDAETVEEAKQRAPIFMRTRGRAVTYEDYEELALEASPNVGRTRCVPAHAKEDGAVRVLIVPELAETVEDRRFEQLIPSEATLKRVAGFLEIRRVIGARVRVQPAVYQGVTIVTDVIAAPGASARDLQDRVLGAIARYVDPMVGGPQGRGWPFGRPLQIGEIYAVVQAVPGVDVVADARLFPADPITGQRGAQTSRVALDADTLLFGFDHQVRVSTGNGS